MGWEWRKGKRYYYHTHQRKVRRRRTYLGPAGDPVAELAAVNAGLHAVHVEIMRRAWEKEKAAVRDAPIIRGINAAWAGLVRMVRGENGHRGTPEPPPDGPEPGPSASSGPKPTRIHGQGRPADGTAIADGSVHTKSVGPPNGDLPCQTGAGVKE